MIKSDSKAIYVTKTWTFFFIKESWKSILVSTYIYIYEAARLFSILIILCFLSLFWFSKLEWFQKDHVTIKTGIVILNIQVIIEIRYVEL